MSYGIMAYMTSIADYKKIWGSKIALAKSNASARMKEELGYSFLARQTGTAWLKPFNKEIKKEYGYANFRAHQAMQDMFDGNISYPNAPWIYPKLLEAIASEIAENHFYEILRGYKEKNPASLEIRRSEEYREKLRNYMYSRVLLKSALKSSALPNDKWYPCDLNIINYLPDKLPIPIPEPDDFPYISAISHAELQAVLAGIDFQDYTKESEEQMRLWFMRAEQEGKDLILFIY